MPRLANLQTFVDRLTSRSRLTAAERDAILGLPTSPRTIHQNEDFIRGGEDGSCVNLVAEGLIARFDQNHKGERQICALHIGGDVPDLSSVVQPSASALQALCTSSVLQIPHWAVRAATGKFPALAEAFWRDSATEASVLAQWVFNIGRHDARSRIAHLLCEMACRYDAHSAGGVVSFHLPMTQQHMADATGLTSVHVNRTLRHMAAMGTSFRNRRVWIEDWDALASIGEFDRGYLHDRAVEERLIRIVN